MSDKFTASEQFQTLLIVMMVILWTMFVGLIASNVGYSVGAKSVQNDAIKAGVAKYVVVNSNSPITEFVFTKQE